MCIITGTVSSVDSTSIFVMPSRDKYTQLTVYSNKVVSPSTNLMILPVPYPNSIQFVQSVMNYKDLFTDIHKSFRKISPYTISATRSISDTLPVYHVGSYDVSIAYTIQDLLRLDRSLFKNPEELFELLQDEYTMPFGFIVCMLKEGGNDYKPLAYSHKLWNNQLFVPTKHYHPGDLPGNQMHSFTDDWNHQIFSLAVPLTTDTHRPTDYVPLSKNRINWSVFPEEFQWDSNIPLRRLEIKGGYRNIDIHLQLPLRPQISYTASFLGLKRGLRQYFNP